MRALLTGGTGFLGTELSNHLRGHGDEVVAFDRRRGDPDITDRGALRKAFADFQPDVVYHLAAQSHVPTAWEDPIATLRINVEGTLNVLDAAVEADVGRVIVSSSAQVYGTVTESALPLAESTPPRPNNPYAASKLAAEALAAQSFHGCGLAVVCLRPFNTIGPGQRREFVGAGLAHRIAVAERDGTSEIDAGRLDVRRDFCDVRDVVRAYRLAATDGKRGATYNVCSGISRSVEELATGLAARSTQPIKFVRRRDLLRPADTPVVYGDPTALQHATGWSCETDFEQSLDDIMNDARERLDDQ